MKVGGTGCAIIFHSSAWRKSTAMRRGALLNEVRQRGAHAPNCSVIECDGYSEWWLSSTRSIQHVYVRGESGPLFVEMSLMRKNAEREIVQDVMEKRCYFALIVEQSSHQRRKQTRIRPTCSQTKSSSLSALNVSVAWKCCSSRVSPVRSQRIPDTSFQEIMKFNVDAQLFCAHIR